MGDKIFELTGDLLEQIIFAMENQKDKFLLDSQGPVLIPFTKERASDAYLIPEWKPSDGYRLMEQFVLTLRNPVFRERLSSILHQGSGVFRKYKDTLNERPDIERLWFTFKEKEMKSRVHNWYNALCLEWGIDPFELDYNGEASPVLTDFSICREEGSRTEELNKLDFDAYKEIYSSYPDDYIKDMFRRMRDGFEAETSDDSLIFCGEDPHGEVVAFIWFTSEILDGGTTLGRIRQLYVKPEYRGLGLADKLKEKILNHQVIEDCHIVEINIPGNADFIRKDLLATGFEAGSTLLVKKA